MNDKVKGVLQLLSILVIPYAMWLVIAVTEGMFGLELQEFITGRRIDWSDWTMFDCAARVGLLLGITYGLIMLVLGVKNLGVRKKPETEGTDRNEETRLAPIDCLACGFVISAEEEQCQRCGWTYGSGVVTLGTPATSSPEQCANDGTKRGTDP